MVVGMSSAAGSADAVFDLRRAEVLARAVVFARGAGALADVDATFVWPLCRWDSHFAVGLFAISSSVRFVFTLVGASARMSPVPANSSRDLMSSQFLPLAPVRPCIWTRFHTPWS